jgi:hypothetical protein
MFRLIRKISTVIALSGIMMFAMMPALASAAPVDEINKGVNAAGGTSSTDPTADVNSLTTNIINILSWVVGVVAVVMIIIGGLSFILAAGDSGRIAKARTTILYAIVGLVVVAFAQIIVRYVLKKVA